MKSTSLPNSWLTLLLGAINGFIVGVIASVAIYLYNEYHNWRLLHGDLVMENSAHFVREVPFFVFVFVLCFFTIVFSVASYVVHRFWFNRLKSLALLWQWVGIAAVVIGALWVLAIDLIEYLSSGFTAIVFKYQNLLSLEFARFCLMSLASLAAINFIYSRILQSLGSGYLKKFNVKLNLP